jgi:hypothetical protein
MRQGNLKNKTALMSSWAQFFMKVCLSSLLNALSTAAAVKLDSLETKVKLGVLIIVFVSTIDLLLEKSVETKKNYKLMLIPWNARLLC